MATATTNSHSGKYRSDPEIEKYRLELNWTKILDKLKTAKVPEYVKFLDGEAQLEYYLQQYPLTDSRNIERSHNDLIRVENLLKSGGSTRSFEGQCLLSKLYYAQARYDECLTYVNLAINSIPIDINEQPNRSSLLLAEIYALNGLLLEKKNENLYEIIKSFDDSYVDEEILLLLLLGQTSTLNEAVLDWQAEHEGQRERSHQAAYNILALLSIFLSRKQAFHIIADSYEQALRFSFEHFQTWFNYGLSLISSGQSFRAYLILKECLRMQPKNIQVYLQLAKIILEYIYDFPSLFETFPSSGEDGQPLYKQTLYQQNNYLNQHEQRPKFMDLIDEAIDYCQQAAKLENPLLSARSLVLLAIAKSFKARQTSIHNDLFYFYFNIKYLFIYKRSIQLDPYDSISHFHLAHNLSFINQTQQALKSIERYLLLSPDDKYALHLYTLLLTAQKQMPEAYAQIYRATNDYPDIRLEIYFHFIFSYFKKFFKILFNKIDEGERCVKEISSLSPLCHQMFYMRGLINDARGQLKLAKVNYNDALAINPYHFPTLIQLTKTFNSNRKLFGMIDKLAITGREKSACEILEEATLVAYFSFNSRVELIDSGPNSLSVVRQSVSFVSNGHSFQAISFNGSTYSYFQISDLTSLGISNRPFSISLWIRPQNLSGTLVHVSSNSSGLGWCVPFLGFTTNGSIVAQISNSAIRSAVGPLIPLAPIWSHIVEIWSPTNRLRLYVNNVLVASTTAMTISYTASSVPNYATLANSVSGAGVCGLGLLGSMGPYNVYLLNSILEKIINKIEIIKNK
ncbi:unnamed protein product [Rotaria sp. Silwood1]|nr:unnamed protein product [Rotaria sp. Silwood1]